ncbi:MAG: hypothetical protein KGH69_01140 [Candidatus Micrarchaeota archaeon]|nr:hypothetical protein [Candidatus Micrarchaeota archaeon]
MPKATLRIELGDNSKDYAAVLDKPKLKGVNVRTIGKGNFIEIEVEADNPASLISAVGILMKQLRTVESVGSLVGKRR